MMTTKLLMLEFLFKHASNKIINLFMLHASQNNVNATVNHFVVIHLVNHPVQFVSFYLMPYNAMYPNRFGVWGKVTE